MNPIYKLFFAVGLMATGGEVATHGDDHARSLKRLAAPFFEDKRPNKGIEPVALSEFDKLPQGIQRIEN